MSPQPGIQPAGRREGERPLIEADDLALPHRYARGGRGRPRLRSGLLACVLVVTGLLGGCGTAETLFGEEDAELTTVSTPPEAAGDQPFPNLSTVPDEPPPTSSQAERAAIQQGLAADRANAEYTGQKLGNHMSPAAAAPAAAPAENEPAAAAPEPPASAPAPASPPPANSHTGVQTAASSSAVESQPIPPAPATPTPQPAPAPAPAAAAQPVTASPPAPPAQVPASVPSVAQSQVLENGSVIINPDAVLGGGPPVASRLLPSGESQPVAMIFFRHGSAGLSRSDIAVLREVVRMHQERGGLIRLIGHASQGPTSRNVTRQNLANFNISLARANAVARELARLGVRSDQIQVAAAGAQRPLYYETQPTGEAGNRRVEIYLDY